MRNIIAVALSAMVLASCSGGTANDSQAAHNDVATGTRLLDVDLNGEMSASDRAARLAECSAVLTSHVGRTPPPERATQLRALADRLQRAAIALGEANGKTAVEINRIRDEAVAAQRQMEAHNAAVYAEAMTNAVERCGLAEAMTDEELAGHNSWSTGNQSMTINLN